MVFFRKDKEMYCTNCGKEVPDSAKVCGYCGTRLKVDEDTATRVEASTGSASGPGPLQDSPTKREGASAASSPPDKPTRATMQQKVSEPQRSEPGGVFEEPKKKIPAWAGFIFGVVLVGVIAVGIVFAMGGFGSSPEPETIIVTQLVEVSAPTDQQAEEPYEEEQEAPVIPEQPAETPEPVVPEEPAPEPVTDLYFTAGETMFCRAGPDVDYEDYWMANEGQTYQVLAVWHTNSNWKLIAMDDPGTRTNCCWVGGSGDLAGSTDTVPAIDYLPDRMACEVP